MNLNKPSRKKVPISISSDFSKYLNEYGKVAKLPIQYKDMSRYISSLPLLNAKGEDLHWQTLIYDHRETEEINDACCEIYALLKTDGDRSVIEHLQVDRIDFCIFGNTHPYRVRIINKINDNYDHFYIKQLDASRIYGLELEYLLSPNNVNYIVDSQTIIEEHIAGIPGDDFMKRNLDVSKFEKIRIAKEFVKFNERCFARLLGDMRSYNYVVDITPDIEGNQYRLRAIDFDQQSYEGRRNFYLPQFFKENNDIINMGMELLTNESVTQYQSEEQSLIARRARNEKVRLIDLLNVMVKDKISDPKKVNRLKIELRKHHNSKAFDNCKTMGELVHTNIQLLLHKEFKQSFLTLKE